MRIVQRILSIALLAGLLAACKQGGNADDAVVATVNGAPITNSMLKAFVRANNRGEDHELDPMQRQTYIHYMVNMELLASEARKEGMDKDAEYVANTRVFEENQLADRYAQNYMKSHQPSDTEIKAFYDEQFKNFDPHQYKAHHILVQSEDQAKGLIAQLHKGAKFDALAAKYSMDPGSKDKGGDLGEWFYASAMVPEFGPALASLKKGEITAQPVKSQYGWHVIRLDDSRIQPPPTMEQLHDRIVDHLQGKDFQDYISKLNSAAKVDIKSSPAPAMAGTLAPPAAATKH